MMPSSLHLLYVVWLYDTSELRIGGVMQVTPSRFVHSMRQKCIKNPQRIVLPEAHDHRIIEAAGAAQSKGIANIILWATKRSFSR